MNHFASRISETEATQPVAKKRLRRPYGWSALLIFIGLLFLCLLNGQVFTNRIVFLGCVTASTLLWGCFINRSLAPDHERSARLIVIIHGLILGAFSSGLSDLYHWQQRFNDRPHGSKQFATEIVVKPTPTGQQNQLEGN